ncbi:MAG: protein kinase [Acidobacteriota bacterium]
MSPERWRRIEELFERAAELPTIERDTWLAQECGADSDLFQEVSQMLEADSHGGVVREQVSAAVTEMTREAQPAGPGRAGPYRLTRELGRGGMGTVYLGERDDGEYEGQVAVKLIRAGFHTQHFLARFKRERQALARLEHPNIARIFDSGTNDEGLPYIVMEMVRGEPITSYAKRLQLTVEQILTLYLEVCRAVGHAHQKFIVHRDLKPGNILVQDDGRPKLLDFGICKLIGDAPPDGSTVSGVHLLTPEFASPEQILDEPITTASDIYSLAAVLYQLLTGRPPHIVTRANTAGMLALSKQQVRPASEVAADRSRAPELQGLLDETLLKALAKDPERRHQSVDEFMRDLERVLNREQGIQQETLIRGRAPAIPRWAFVALGGVVLAGGLSWTALNWFSPETRRVDVATMPAYLEAHRILKVDVRAAPFADGVGKALRALAIFDQAAREHPDSALLQSGIAEAEVVLADLDPIRFYEHMRKAGEAAHRGLQLDNSLEELHHSLAVSLLFGAWQPAKALEEFDRAVRINPRKSSSHRLRADIFCMFGRYQDALAALDAVLAVSPVDTEIGGEKAMVYYRWRRLVQAEQTARQTLAVKSDDAMSRFVLGLIHQAQGHTAEAEKLFRSLPERPGRYPLALAQLLLSTGRSGEAGPAIELVSKYHRNPSARALLTLTGGDREGAINLLEQAYNERDINLMYVAMDPRYDLLRDDPRFVELFKRIGVPAAP